MQSNLLSEKLIVKSEKRRADSHLDRLRAEVRYCKAVEGITNYDDSCAGSTFYNSYCRAAGRENS